MSRRSHESISETKKAVAIAAMSTLAIGGMIGLSQKADEGAVKNFNKIEQEAVNNIEKARNSIMIVNEGAIYRTAPFTVNSGDGGPDTVAGKVSEGHALKINNGIEHIDASNDLWVGFYLENETSERNTARAEDLQWINVTELQRQSDPTDPYITEFRRADIGSKPTPTDIAISVNPEQQIVIGAGKDGGPDIGNAEIMTHAELLQELANESLLIKG